MRPCRPSAAPLAMRIPAMSTMSTTSRPCMSTRLFSSSSVASSDSSFSSSDRAPSDLTQRSLFINVRPSPTSLAERRSVLGVLERYGKAKFFKKLADNSSFVCIASSTTMASTLVQRSPFQYELLAETLQAAKPWGQPRVASLVQPIETTAASSSHSSSSPSASPSSSSSSPIQNRSFVISVFPAKDYNHRSVTRSSPLHGPWPRDRDEGPSGMQTIVSSNSDGYRDTFVYNALRAVVPESASSAALCDWRTRQPAAGYDAAVTSTSDSTPDKKATSRIQERRAKRAYEGKSILSTLVGRTSGNGGSNGGKGNSGRNSFADT